MKTLTIEQRSNYGKTTFYPVCAESKLFAQIAGTTTLTIEVLRLIKALGYTINVRVAEVTI